MEYNFLKISFRENFYNGIRDLYFSENKDILYYDNSHMNYIYKLTIDNILYTFYGFYRENYFNIIFDSYDSILDITIKNKFTLLINLDWKLSKYNNTSIWVVNNVNNITKQCIILPITNKMINNNINIEDYIKIYNLKRITVNIKNIDEIDNYKKKFNIFKKVKLYFNLENYEF